MKIWSSTLGECPHCKKSFTYRGLRRHMKACKAKICSQCSEKCKNWKVEFIECPKKDLKIL